MEQLLKLLHLVREAGMGTCYERPESLLGLLDYRFACR